MDFQVNPNEVYSGQSKWSVFRPIEMKCINANPNEVYSGQSKWSVLKPIQMQCIQANNGKFTVIMGATICMEGFTKNIKILY